MAHGVCVMSHAITGASCVMKLVWIPHRRIRHCSWMDKQYLWLSLKGDRQSDRLIRRDLCSDVAFRDP